MSAYEAEPLTVVDDPNECTMIVRGDAVVARMEVYSSTDPDDNDAVQLARAHRFAASDQMLEQLEDFEWCREFGGGLIFNPPLRSCPRCEQLQTHGHLPTCSLAAVIAKARGRSSSSPEPGGAEV